MFGGKTVEVLNTDAEGRLVMADGLAAASLEKPDVDDIDIATLTGAQMLALGLRTAGVMGDKQVTNDLVAVSDKVGELAWAMPLPEELRPSISRRFPTWPTLASAWAAIPAAVFLRNSCPVKLDGKNTLGLLTCWPGVR